MADQGFGLTITFSSGFCAQVTGAAWSGIKREALKTTHMTTTSGWETFIASDIKTMGTLKVDLEFNPSTTPPITGAAETITVTFPIPAGGSTAATWACSGFLVGFDANLPMDNIMTAAAEIQFTGVPTFTAGT